MPSLPNPSPSNLKHFKLVKLEKFPFQLLPEMFNPTIPKPTLNNQDTETLTFSLKSLNLKTPEPTLPPNTLNA